MKKSRYQIDPLQDCLRDEQAAQEFYKLVNGEYTVVGLIITTQYEISGIFSSLALTRG